MGSLLGVIFVSVLFGLLVGTAFGLLSRLFFRTSFQEYISDEYKAAQDQLEKQIKDVQNQINVMVAKANAEVAAIYRNATIDQTSDSVQLLPKPKGHVN